MTMLGCLPRYATASALLSGNRCTYTPTRSGFFWWRLIHSFPQAIGWAALTGAATRTTQTSKVRQLNVERQRLIMGKWIMTPNVDLYGGPTPTVDETRRWRPVRTSPRLNGSARSVPQSERARLPF